MQIKEVSPDLNLIIQQLCLKDRHPDSTRNLSQQYRTIFMVKSHRFRHLAGNRAKRIKLSMGLGLESNSSLLLITNHSVSVQETLACRGFKKSKIRTIFCSQSLLRADILPVTTLPLLIIQIRIEQSLTAALNLHLTRLI